MDDLTSKKRYVSYLRVSTQKQGKSGLGIEAQRSAVAQYLGNSGVLLAEFSEVESGKKSDRPELAKALEWCKLTHSTLIVAKLDRLTRNVVFLGQLYESGVPFVAADLPGANEMTVMIMIVMAQAERKACSARTKAALQAAKERGKKLGCPLGAKAFGEKRGLGATEALKAKADNFAKSMAAHVLPLKEQGLSLRQIAKTLNDKGLQTVRGKEWQANSVRQLLERL